MGSGARQPHRGVPRGARPALLAAHRSALPRGLGRVIFHAWHWVFDREAHPLRLAAVQSGDASGYAALARIRNQRVRQRLYVLGALASLLILASAVVVIAAPGPASWGLPLLAVAVLGWLGRPAGKPFVQAAIVSAKAERLTPDIIIRALGSLSLSGIDKVLREGREITFVSPVVRDGPGWRVAIDLPYGVTVSDVIERREKLASGLRRPLGCVWPEPSAEEHAGRLVLFVGDEPLSKARQPVYPLAKAGRADLFKPVPFGTDQRGKPVTLPLMFANLLIGSIPRQGKTVAMRVALLAAALDPLAEIHVHELKGTGDLGPLEKVAHKYGSGADDATIEAALADLRQLADVELIRRAKVIKGLPRDLCPDSKITPAARRQPVTQAAPDRVRRWTRRRRHSATPTTAPRSTSTATALIKRGPALGIMLILATQRPDAKSLPTGITSNASIRFCLRVMDQVANDMVLGTSSYKRGRERHAADRLGQGLRLPGRRRRRRHGVQDVQRRRPGRREDLRPRPPGPRAGRAAHRLRRRRDRRRRRGQGVAPDRRLRGHRARARPTCGPRSSARGWLELRPALYGGLDPTGLATALAAYGIATKQVWGTTADGKKANRRGVTRADVLAAISSGSPLDPSGPASGQSAP